MAIRRIVWSWLLLLLLGVSGCSLVPGAGKGEISFGEIFESRQEDELKIERTVELDVDADGHNEWLVLYRYDPTDQNAWANTPVQGIVYDAVPCDPPLIHNWRLPFPDNDYVGEGEDVRAYMADWLGSRTPGEVGQELIIEGPGPVNTLSIYRFHDYQNNPCLPPDDTRQGFSLLGFFRSNGPITWDEEARTVTTHQRTSFERSQLAIRSTYQPNPSVPLEEANTVDQTFLGSNGRTKNPDEQTIDFLYGLPRSPTDSPYPEKAVASFYLNLGTDPGKDNERAQSYLAEALQPIFAQNGWGLDLLPSQVRRVIIYSISYTPDREAERRHLDREITVVVAAVDQNNQAHPPRRVTWRLVGIPIDTQDELDCEWRLAEIKGETLSGGLGLLTNP